MLNRILYVGLATTAVTAMLFCSADFASAGGSYTLKYPQGWGCCCTPNPMQFGYYHTGWREWPGEIRPDKTFPRSIGMELLPTPAGEKMPLPTRVKLNELPKPGEEQPVPGPEGEAPPTQEGLPGTEAPTEGQGTPGMETPVLPGLPQEPEGFNPLPGLPSDLGAPATQDNKENKTPGDETKKESESKEGTSEKSNSDSSAPNLKTNKSGAQHKTKSNVLNARRLEPVQRLPKAGAGKVGENLILQPETDIEPEHNAHTYGANIARGGVYHEPAETPTALRLAQNVVKQSYQQPAASNPASAVVQSDLQADLPANESRQDVPRVALDGFCPIELSLHGSWVKGDPRWTVVYKGFIYRFAGNAQRQMFLTNPGKYIPVNGGCDPVISILEKRNISGQVSFCAAYKGRIFMFSSAGTQESFRKNPDLYAGSAIK
jgi:YHS domain-containing protein